MTMIRGLSFLALIVAALFCLGYAAQQYREAEAWRERAGFWEAQAAQIRDANGELVDQLTAARDETQRARLDLARAVAPVIHVMPPAEVAPVAPVATPRRVGNAATVDPSVSRYYPGTKGAADRAADALESIDTQLRMQRR